jgi:hypothetical protein
VVTVRVLQQNSPDSGHLSGDFRFDPDFVCFASRCGLIAWRPPTSAPDPKRKFAVPEKVEHWSLTALREKLINIGPKVVSHGRYITFQLAEIAISKRLFANILRSIDDPQPAPLPP